MNQDLVNYIKQQQSLGKPKDQITQTLLASGWKPEDVNEAFVSLENPAPVVGLDPLSAAPVTSHMNKKLLGIIGGVVVLLLAGGVLAYTFMPKSPEKILEKALANSGKITSSEFFGTMEGKVKVDTGIGTGTMTQPDMPMSQMPPASPKSEFGFKLNYGGASDKTDKENPKSSFDINASAEGFLFAMQGVTISNKILYLKINEFPALGFFDGSQIKNKWIKMDLQELSEQAGVKLDEIFKQSKLTDEDMQKIYDSFKKHQVLKLTGNLPSESIDGHNTYHYKFTINKDNLIVFIKDIRPILEKDGMERLGDQDFQEMEKAFQNFNFTNSEIWIGKKDYYIYRIKLGIDITVPQQAGSASFMLTSNAKNFNKKVLIEEPEDATDFKEIYQNFTGIGFGASSKARDAKRVGDIRQIQTAMELFFNDVGYYPFSNSSNKPANDKFNTYLGSWPEAPTPADGPCVAENNTYAYLWLSPSNYKLTFCLGSQTSGFSAGMHTASPSGIQ